MPCPRPLVLCTLGSARPHLGRKCGALLTKALPERKCACLCAYKTGPQRQVAALEFYSCSLRCFLRLRFRANASFTRLFSPGFR